VSRSKEISSTEKLLQVIRGDGEAVGDTPKTPPPLPRTKKRLLRLPSMPIKKTLTVGVDIGRDDIKLVKVLQAPDKRCILQGYASCALPAGMAKSDPDFPLFLRSLLTEVCGDPGRYAIWSSIPFVHMEIRHFRIPKVPRRQVASAVYWMLKKEAPFDEREVLVDFEGQGQVFEKGVPKTAVMAYTARRDRIEQIRLTFEKAGFPLAGITSAPFCNQNLFSACWLPCPREAVATLYIGNEHSRIDVFCGGTLVLTRGVKTGINSMIESLVEGYNARHRQIALELPDGQSAAGPASVEEKVSLDQEQARRMILGASGEGAPLEKGEPGAELPDEEVFQLLAPAADRLVRQLERTMEHYTVTLGNQRFAMLYISGVMGAYGPLIRHIGEQLGIATDVIDPLDPSIPFLGNVVPPASASERTAFALALSLALSHNQRTPNLLFTHHDKEEKAVTQRINRAVLAGFLVLMLGGYGYYQYQGGCVAAKKKAIAQLRQELDTFHPPLDQGALLVAAGEVKRRQEAIRARAERYLGMALLSEVIRLTPENVRLLNITTHLDAEDKEKKGKQAQRSVLVEGIVLGDESAMEAALAGYAMRLEFSPLLERPEIEKNVLEAFRSEGKVLRFIIRLSVV